MTYDDLDNLLSYLHGKGTEYVKYRDIVAEHYKNNETTFDIEGMLVKLKKDGFVDTGKFTQGGDKLGWVEQKTYKLSFEGRLLFENSSHNKPYLGLNRRKTQRQIWVIAKIVIATLNAIAILYLMWRAIPNNK
jgi:hypothetical protein